MTTQQDSVECASCGTPIDIGRDTPNFHVPCSNCGSNGRVYNVSIMETIVAHDGIGITARRAGEKKPYVENKGMPSYSHRLSKFVHHERLIDRDNDHYRETITDYESGEVIHHCEEPLSEHQNHGSAKIKNTKPHT